MPAAQPVADSVGRRPRILDLFCGAGGASMGYSRAGFEVVGVDITEQPRYPFGFLQSDAIAVLDTVLAVGGKYDAYTFDAIHASPPCQGYSRMSTCRPGLADEYPRLIEPVRERLVAIGLPYVIENVVGAPLRWPTLLCGAMFGREVYRHRLFETSFPTPQLPDPEHVVPTSKAGHWTPGTYISIAGHCSPMALAREVMDIDWMRREELAEAIPPYFTEFIGTALMAHLGYEQDEERASA